MCGVGRIEETWRLWCKFQEDHSRFEDWLTEAERVAANPNSSDVLYADAKEELKSFEVRELVKDHTHMPSHAQRYAHTLFYFLILI